MKKKWSDEEIDRLGRKLVHAVAPDPTQSSEAVFLAGFRRKLDDARAREDGALTFLGNSCWRIAPVTALAAIFLCVTLFAVTPPAATVNEPSEDVFWALAGDELSDELLLDAIFSRR